MRVLVMFDLPVDTNASVRAYNRFRKDLLREGFFMLQKSVYTKLVLNAAAGKSCIDRVRSFAPATGAIMAFIITEKQFSNFELICGSSQSEYIDSMDKVVII